MDPRKPVIPISVEEDEEFVVLRRDGTTRSAARVVLSEEDTGRIRAGYVCAVCFEPQERPFPKKCWVCGFEMADRQSEYVSKAYQGTVRVGPSSSLEDELAALDELEERERRESQISVPQILVPRVW